MIARRDSVENRFRKLTAVMAAAGRFVQFGFAQRQQDRE